MTELGIAFELDTKGVTDEGEFVGYGAVFNNEDLGRDIIVPGAFAKSIARRPAGKVKMLRGHDTNEPIGIWLDLAEDKKGLRAKGKLILETTLGRETHALMRAGALDGLSIGFRTVKDRYDRAKGVRYLEELDVPEISVVTFPMNPRATISTVKSEEAERTRALVKAITRATEALRL